MRKFIFLSMLMTFAAGLFPQSIQVIQPWSDWAVAIGKSLYVNWQRSGTMANTAKILLYQGPALIQTIVSSTSNSAAYNSFEWTVPPSTPRGYYRVRVQTTDNAVYGDSTEFVIWDEGVLVISPNGGETLVHGKSHTIWWHRVGLGTAISFTIELWKDGVKIGDIAASADPDSHIHNPYPTTKYTYDWSVGQYKGGSVSAGSGYKIKVLCIYNHFDESDGPFQITIDIRDSLKRFGLLNRIPVWRGGGCPECLVFDLMELRRILGNEAKPLEVALFIDDIQAASLGRFGRGLVQSPTIQVRLGDGHFRALQAGGRRLQLRFFDAGRLIHTQDIAVDFRR